jgi:hypothetical protein
MSERIDSAASRRKCLLFAVSVLRADLSLIEEAIPGSAVDSSWGFVGNNPTTLPTLRVALETIERAADGELEFGGEAVREKWMCYKEAAVMNRDFELAAYFRDTQDILLRIDPEFPRRPPYHVRAARALSRSSRSGPTLASQHLADVFGPFPAAPFSSEWRTDTAVSLARTMYEAREFSAMPILADALQDAGCDNDDVLSHCRDANQAHVRGCWVVDLVLGKE